MVFDEESVKKCGADIVEKQREKMLNQWPANLKDLNLSGGELKFTESDIQKNVDEVIAEVTMKFSKLIDAILEISELCTSRQFVGPRSSLIQGYGEIVTKSKSTLPYGEFLYEKLVQLFLVTIAEKHQEYAKEEANLEYSNENPFKRDHMLGELAVKLCPLTLPFSADGARYRSTESLALGTAVIAATGGTGVGLAIGVGIILGGALYDAL